MITINYLSCKRLHYFELFLLLINKIKKENKEKILLKIFTTQPNRFINLNTDIKYEVVTMLREDYIDKIDFIKENTTTEYSMKHDEDIFIPPSVYDFMIENVDILDNSENLTLVPMLSMCVPTIEYFINMFDDDVKKGILDNFSKFRIGASDSVKKDLWGADVSFLNQHLSDKWDGNKWLDIVNNLPQTAQHYGRSYHPIRHAFSTPLLVNDHIIDNIEKLLKEYEYDFKFIKNRYLTNSAFMIKTSTWLEVLNDKSLYMDAFDEVPLNKFLEKYNLNHVLVNNGYSIHTGFNTNMYPRDEEKFFQRLKNKIFSYYADRKE